MSRARFCADVLRQFRAGHIPTVTLGDVPDFGPRGVRGGLGSVGPASALRQGKRRLRVEGLITDDLFVDQHIGPAISPVAAGGAKVSRRLDRRNLLDSRVDGRGQCHLAFGQQARIGPGCHQGVVLGDRPGHHVDSELQAAGVGLVGDAFQRGDPLRKVLQVQPIASQRRVPPIQGDHHVLDAQRLGDLEDPLGPERRRFGGRGQVP